MLTQRLEKCNEFITLKPIERQVFTEHYDRIRGYVIDQMKKKDYLFNKIFHETQLSGSYAAELKVSKPDEYDVLMILELPVERVTVGKLGYVQIKLEHHWRYRLISDRYGFLIQNKVLEWLRRIVQRIFPKPSNRITFENYSYKVSRSISGPTNTLKIKCCGFSNHDNIEFSVDFVVALEFPVNVWKADVDIPKERFLHHSWNAVAKPRKSTQKGPRSRGYSQQYADADTLRKRYWRNQNINRNWICSYAAIEREVISGLNSVKPLIRIFKKIRDTHATLTNLKSYYIKQIFIHQLMSKDAEYWDRSLGDLFWEMLDVVIKYLERGKLSFYWHKNFDLFHNYDSEQIDAMKHKFKRIQEDLKRNGPEYIYKVILTDDEQRQISRSDDISLY